MMMIVKKTLEGSCEKFGMTKYIDIKKMKSIEQKSRGRKT